MRGFLKLLVCFFMTSQGPTFAQTVIYFQNQNPESSAFIDLKYYTLESTAPAGSWFYLKGNVNLVNPLILAYQNTPDTTDPFNFLNFGVEQLTLIELSSGEYRTATASGASLNYFAIWTGEGTWDCILVSNSNAAVCQSAPSAADTLASMQRNAAALRNAFNLQSAKMAQGLSYDCSVFDAKNICVSFAGTRSDGKGGLDDTRGALIVAHKPNANVRFGGYIDQSFNSSESGGLKVKHSSPGYGVFAVWSEKADGSGLQVRGSASFGKADMESTRSEVGTAEAGFGKSDIKSDGFQIEASRDYAVNAMWSARPYVGFRQLTNRRASYSETDSVVFPLSYSSIKQSTQSILAGVRFAHTISAQTTMTVAAGLEHDIKNDVDRYEATGVDDLGSIDMEDGKKNTRPTLSLGLTHVIDKAQRIGVSITHREEAFESGSTTSGMVQYSRGF